MSFALLLTACGDDTKTEKDNAKNISAQEGGGVEIEHEIDKPFLYPFGLELDKFEAEGYRMQCGGDCCVAIEALGLGEYTLYRDTLDCSDYGHSIKFFLFKGKDLIAVHERGTLMEDMPNGDFKTVRIERTVDFENEKTFARRDTIDKAREFDLSGDFKEEIFDRSEKSEYIKGTEDPRERYNFMSNDDYTLYHDGRNGELGTVGLIAHKSDVDIEILEAYSLMDIQNFDSRNIPKQALFAYSTWWAGGGDIIYGKLNDGVLQIYYSYEDEMLAEVPEYELFLEIDPDVTKKKPDHYIVFDPEKGKNKLIFGFDNKGKALYAKYQGQARHIELRKKADKSKGKNIVTVYEELIHGVPNGTYTHTHNGNWDYVTYKGKNGKVSEFTINHSLTVPENTDTYRDRPLF